MVGTDLSMGGYSLGSGCGLTWRFLLLITAVVAQEQELPPVEPPKFIELQCCDPQNYIEITANISTAGLGSELPLFGTRYEAASNNSHVCPVGFQCVDCNAGSQSDFDDGMQNFGANICEDIKCVGVKAKKFQGRCFPCLKGDYCPEGTINKYSHALGTICPDGQVCYEDHFRGKIKDYTKAQCPEGNMCPMGSYFSSRETSCQSFAIRGLRAALPASNISDLDPNGFYCKAGTSGFEKLKQDPTHRLQKCRKGHFCQDSYSEETCPEGKFCKLMVSMPEECPSGTCPGMGNTKPGAAVSRTWFLAVCFFAIWVLCKLLILFNERRTMRTSLNVMVQGKVREVRDVFVRQVLQGLDVEGVGAPPAGFQICEQPIKISFKELQLTLYEQPVLNKVTGAFEAAHMAAVMGPSGCGKSTLLNTLCGRAGYGEMAGSVKLNDVEQPISVIATLMGFVPQDDTVYGDLTVLENIQFSAFLRLPAAYSKQRRKQLVEGTITVLQLLQIQNSIVGTVEKRGISGGQKKRVNIGVEMVTDPTVLFLDEPTSGLGATDTLIVMKALHSLALTHRTIISVIHQPRYQVFMLFHDILLLFPGGYTVFFGPAFLAEPYFEAIGFKVPANENPADFFLDVLSGVVPKARDPSFKPEGLYTMWRDDVEMLAEPHLESFLGEEKMKSLNKTRGEQVEGENVFIREAIRRVGYWWEQNDLDGNGSLDREEAATMFKNMGLVESESELAAVFDSMDTDHSGTVDRNEFEAVFISSLQMFIKKDDDKAGEDQTEIKMESSESKVDYSREPIKPRQTHNVVTMFAKLLKRSMVQKLRMMDEMLSNLVTLALCGLLVGVLLSSDHQPFDPGDPMMALIVCLVTAVVGCISAVNSITVFGNEKVMFLRESAAGINVLAYFLAKVLLDIFENLWQPIFFLGVCYNWIVPRISFFRFSVALCLASFAASGIGILISIIVSPASMTLVATMLTLIVGIFLSGMLGVYYEDVKKSQLAWLWSCSFSRWAAEVVLVGELEASAEESYQYLLIQQTIRYYGFFPRWETYDDWQEKHPEPADQRDQWYDYLDSYGQGCYMALFGIGLFLRAISVAILIAQPWLTQLYDSLRVKFLQDWPHDVAEYVVLPQYKKNMAKAMNHTKKTVRKSFRKLGSRDSYMPRQSMISAFKSSLSPKKKNKNHEFGVEEGGESTVPTLRRGNSKLEALAEKYFGDVDAPAATPSSLQAHSIPETPGTEQSNPLAEMPVEGSDPATLTDPPSPQPFNVEVKPVSGEDPPESRKTHELAKALASHPPSSPGGLAGGQEDEEQDLDGH